MTAICLLLFVGAVGKSAQIPLFPWLADAMEGPTPVSALIHAATMVTAGVYLMCRISPLLAAAPDARLVIAIVGAVTAFVAATIACAQQDIKKVLAYSTVSQLGYMFLAVGTGAYEAAIFLMVAHAFFKALLFLGAGSVIHGLHDEQDLKRMGNLRRYMKLTFLTFGIGWLAIAGIPPLSGFFAKGDILDNAFARYPALWVVGLITAGLTAYYMTRLFVLTFYGEDRWKKAGAGSGHDAGAPHESPWVMALPLVVLAALALVGGLLDLPGHLSFDPLGWLTPVFGGLYQAHQSPGTQWVLAVVDAAVALLGLGVSYGVWSRSNRQPGPRADGAAEVLLHRRDLRRRHRSTGRGFRLPHRRLRQQGHRRGRERGGPSGPGGGGRSAEDPDRIRPAVCARDRPGGGGPAGLHADEGVVTHDSAFPFLTVLVLLPAGAALVAALVPKTLGEKRQRLVVEIVGLAATVATLALAITIAVRYQAGNGSYRLVSDHQWAPTLGIGWHLGVDGISVFLLLMSAVLFPLVLLAGREKRDPRSFVAWLLLLETACLGSFVALDLILFFCSSN